MNPSSCASLKGFKPKEAWRQPCGCLMVASGHAADSARVGYGVVGTQWVVVRVQYGVGSTGTSTVQVRVNTVNTGKYGQYWAIEAI